MRILVVVGGRWQCSARFLRSQEFEPFARKTREEVLSYIIVVDIAERVPINGRLPLFRQRSAKAMWVYGLPWSEVKDHAVGLAWVGAAR